MQVEVAFILRTKLGSCSAGKDRKIFVFEKQHIWNERGENELLVFQLTTLSLPKTEECDAKKCQNDIENIF